MASRLLRQRWSMFGGAPANEPRSLAGGCSMVPREWISSELAPTTGREGRAPAPSLGNVLVRISPRRRWLRDQMLWNGGPSVAPQGIRRALSEMQIKRAQISLSAFRMLPPTTTTHQVRFKPVLSEPNVEAPLGKHASNLGDTSHRNP
jgi:hypothetical protein